jgi:serine protease Do
MMHSSLQRLTGFGLTVSIMLTPSLAFAALPPAVSTSSPSTTVNDAFEGLLRDEALRIKIVQKAEPAVASVLVSNGSSRSDGDTVTSGGSAFFLSADGLLMTNNHILDKNTSQYTILLNNGKTLPAKVVYTNSRDDIALMQVQTKNMPFLKFARRDRLYLAQTVIAIGNSLGRFQNTVSIGIISGLQRSVTASSRSGDFSERLEQIVQIDAALNEGSSGGPLLNSRGEVIGMNTAFIAESQSIGFAVPVAALRKAVAEYKAKK